MLTCSHCQQRSDDVAAELVYEGGRGYVWRDLCGDRGACWVRFDINHGLLQINQVA